MLRSIWIARAERRRSPLACDHYFDPKNRFRTFSIAINQDARPNDTVPLELNERERELILSYTFADESLTNRLRVVSKKGERPIFRFTLDDLDELAGFLAAEANHAKNKILGEQLDQLCDRIEATLSKYTDEATIN